MGNTYRWRGGSGSFSAVSNWQVLQNGGLTSATTTPGTGDIALIGSGSVLIGAPAGAALTLDGSGAGVTISSAAGLQPPLSVTVADTAAPASGTLTLRGQITSSATLAALTTGATLAITATQSFTNTGLLLAGAGATLSVQSSLVNHGTVMVQGASGNAAQGTLQAVSAGGGAPGFLMVGSGTLEVSGAVDAGETVAFTDAAGTLVIDSPGSFAGTIIGFAPGDVIEIPQGYFPSAVTAIGQSSRLVLQSGTKMATLAIDPVLNFAGTAFTAGLDSLGNTLLTLLPGTPQSGVQSWIGPSGTWSVAGGWSNGVVPGASDAVQVIGTAGQPFALTVNDQETAGLLRLLAPPGTLAITGGLTVGQALLTAGSLAVGFGGSFGVAGGVTAGSQATLAIGGGAGNAGTLTIGGTLALQGVLDVTGGSTGQIGGLVAANSVSVDAQSTLVVGSGGAPAGAAGLVVAPGATATISGGSVAGLLTVDGLLLAGGALLAATLAGTGTISFGSGGNLHIAGSTPVQPALAFSGPGQTLVLDQPIQPGGTILNFAAGKATPDTIDLDTVPYQPGNQVYYNAQTGFLTLIPAAAGQPVQAMLTLQPGLQLAVTAASDGRGGTDLVGAPPCYAASTRIAVPGCGRGVAERPVQSLRPGDLVLTLGGARLVARPVRWVGSVTIDLAAHPRPQQAAPVRIRANAFAPGVPRRDLLLSPDHAVLWQGALIHAGALVNGATIVRAFPHSISYWHVELDRHAILLAEGLAAESYLDLGNRGLFAGSSGVRALHPDLTLPLPDTWDAHACAALLVGDTAVASARAALAQRAEALGWRRETRSGRWLAPARRARVA